MSALSQAFPPSPEFTEKNVSDQHGKVFIVTGASSGVGKELARLLFGLNAKVYVAARSESNARTAIADIRAGAPSSRGELVFLPISLDDLASVKQAASTFLLKETRLDALWHNAGVMFPPLGSKTKQGFDLQVGVHCIAPFLLTQFLTPILIETARLSTPGSVRVVWVSSSAAELMTSKQACLDLKKWAPSYKVGPKEDQYGPSKAGMVILSQEYAKQHRDNGIVSVALNPGNLQSNLTRHTSWAFRHATNIVLYKPINGAYTELFAGFSPNIGMSNSGCWGGHFQHDEDYAEAYNTAVIPFGRIHPIRRDIQDAGRPRPDGGSGLGQALWDWCAEQVNSFV